LAEAGSVGVGGSCLVSGGGDLLASGGGEVAGGEITVVDCERG